MHHRPRVCGRSACVGVLHYQSMHTTAHVYETHTAIPSDLSSRKLKTKKSKKNGTLLLRDGDISFPFPVMASNYGRNWLAPPKSSGCRF